MALFALLLVVLTAHFVAVLDAWFDAVRYPFELDYGEGIVWQQAMLIPGSRMYGNIHDFPYIVFHYPPVYHLAVHAIASLGVDWLIAGRGLSVVAAFATGTLVAALVFHAARTSKSRTASMVGASVAGLITFTYVPVVVCASLMRVDMLAVALSFLGVYCAIRSLDRPWLLYPAVVAFVLAVFTKQTAVAAPLATFPVLFLLEPRRVLQGNVLRPGTRRRGAGTSDMADRRRISAPYLALQHQPLQRAVRCPQFTTAKQSRNLSGPGDRRRCDLLASYRAHPIGASNRILRRWLDASDPQPDRLRSGDLYGILRASQQRCS